MITGGTDGITQKAEVHMRVKEPEGNLIHDHEREGEIEDYAFNTPPWTSSYS